MTANNYQIDSASISDRGLSEKRPQNEDSFLELNKRGLFAVADGVGGAQAGDVASQMAVEILGEAFVNSQKNGDAEDLMRLAIERANEAIFQMSHDLAQLSTMATTMVALHVEGTIATIGHVGDSRLYRLDPQGNFYRETQDHSVVEEEVRAGRMTQEQAAHHPSRNVISRALGAEHAVEVDMKTIMIEPNTTFLLCSDGVTRHIDDFQLRELLLFKDTPENICGRIKEVCYERGAEDNLTAVIARITDKVAENYVGEPNEKPARYEEATVAAARPSAGGEATGGQFLVEETPTQPLTIPATSAAEATDSIRSDSQSSITNRTQESNAASRDVILQETNRGEKVYRAGNETNNGNLSRLLSSILFLIVGGILGAGIYYLFSQNNRQPEVPQLAQQSPNIEFSSFETLRRSVDNDPNTFINRNANITQDAEGLYLLGRAYLLTGKYPEAKKSFEDARNKLGQTGVVNGKVLATDIALGMSIIDEAAAQEKFQNQTNSNAANPNTQTNPNVNAQ